MTLVILKPAGMYSPGKRCTCIGVGSITSPTGSLLPLCTQHYQLVYRMRNVKESEVIVCQLCGIKHKQENGAVRRFLSWPEPTKLDSGWITIDVLFGNALSLKISLLPHGKLCGFIGCIAAG